MKKWVKNQTVIQILICNFLKPIIDVRRQWAKVLKVLGKNIIAVKIVHLVTLSVNAGEKLKLFSNVRRLSEIISTAKVRDNWVINQSAKEE